MMPDDANGTGGGGSPALALPLQTSAAGPTTSTTPAAGTQQAHTAGSASQLGNKRYHVLVAEDDPSTLRLVQALLQKCNYEVSVAKNGREALQVLESCSSGGRKVDLILTDILMPEVSGMDLLCAVFQDERWHGVPVIVMSSEQSQDSVMRAFEAGARDYLIKPVRRNELTTLWRHVWRRESAGLLARGDSCQATGTVAPTQLVPAYVGGQRHTNEEATVNNMETDGPAQPSSGRQAASCVTVAGGVGDASDTITQPGAAARGHAARAAAGLEGESSRWTANGAGKVSDRAVSQAGPSGRSSDGDMVSAVTRYGGHTILPLSHRFSDPAKAGPAATEDAAAARMGGSAVSDPEDEEHEVHDDDDLERGQGGEGHAADVGADVMDLDAKDGGHGLPSRPLDLGPCASKPERAVQWCAPEGGTGAPVAKVLLPPGLRELLEVAEREQEIVGRAEEDSGCSSTFHHSASSSAFHSFAAFVPRPCSRGDALALERAKAVEELLAHGPASVANVPGQAGSMPPSIVRESSGGSGSGAAPGIPASAAGGPWWQRAVPSVSVPACEQAAGPVAGQGPFVADPAAALQTQQFFQAFQLAVDQHQRQVAEWKANRQAAIAKFKQKRKSRNFDKKVRYESRKRLAESRPRIKGQFVKAEVAEAYYKEQQAKEGKDDALSD